MIPDYPRHISKLEGKRLYLTKPFAISCMPQNITLRSPSDIMHYKKLKMLQNLSLQKFPLGHMMQQSSIKICFSSFMHFYLPASETCRNCQQSYQLEQEITAATVRVFFICEQVDRDTERHVLTIFWIFLSTTILMVGWSNVKYTAIW